MATPLNRLILAQFKRITDEPNEYVKFSMTDDVNVWYASLSGLIGDDEEFAGGEYLIKIHVIERFPFVPPVVTFITPNGVFKCDQPVGLDLLKDEYWRPTLGLGGVAFQIAAALMQWKDLGECGIANTDPSTKRTLASLSREYNRKYFPEIICMIDESYAEYSANRRPIKYSGAHVVTGNRAGYKPACVDQTHICKGVDAPPTCTLI